MKQISYLKVIGALLKIARKVGNCEINVSVKQRQPKKLLLKTKLKL